MDVSLCRDLSVGDGRNMQCTQLVYRYKNMEGSISVSYVIVRP
jgi:hypothetical protein